MAKKCKYCGRKGVLKKSGYFGVETESCMYCGRNQNMKGKKGQSLYPSGF